MSGATRGDDCKVYRNTGTWGTPVYNELEHVTQINPVDSKTEITIPIRRRRKFYQPGQRDLQLEITLIEVVGDAASAADLQAFIDAYNNETTLEVLTLDGVVTAAGSQGGRGDYHVTAYTPNQEADNIMTHVFTLRQALTANQPVWFTAA
jgi:hypothetical protein